ncbi:zinc ribbon domain-containing protein [Fructilactobacillus sanfranciscensis]|uniref:zinc ribbon domain-containing protein n=1 Tax=Fructilactobacillus sanfranciscensis TaxID=1625 RepID=UPI0013D117EE|nr:zinc ribbon domain-containing protein [Fructilactobacillus sanfranciscensis]NDR98292.1 DUF4767 domain-containing protein [Fructilactobacillus sanfranciscensis]
MKFCPHCGNKVADDTSFCDKCGNKLTVVSRQAHKNFKPKQHKNLFFTLILIALVVVIGAGIYLFTSGATNDVSTKQPSATTSKFKQNETKPAKSQTKKVTAKNSVSKSANNSTIWNSSKNTKLENFMSSWGSSMNQDYDYFNPDNQDNYMGYHFPDDFSKGNIRVGGSPVSVGWSDDGTGSSDYNVVAIYSDIDSDRNKGTMLAPHLYLFTIHEGQPVVLITQQTQGNPENAIYFNPTSNQDLSSQFANIVNNNQMTY